MELGSICVAALLMAVALGWPGPTAFMAFCRLAPDELSVAVGRKQDDNWFCIINIILKN